MTPHSFPFQPSFPIAFLAVALASLAGCFGPGPGWDEHYDLNPYAQLLSATKESPVRIEIHYVEGRQPANSTLEAISTTLEEVNGPWTVWMGQPQPVVVADPSQEKLWKGEELFSLVEPVLERGCDPLHRCVSVFFVNGRYENPEVGEVWGVALFGQYPFVFVDGVRELSRVNGLVLPEPIAAETIERSVAVHELGHVLGLVESGIPMRESRHPPPDEDPCQCHSSQEDSVMYVGVDRVGIWQERIFQDGTHYSHEFNAADWRDIRAFQAEVAAAQG